MPVDMDVDSFVGSLGKGQPYTPPPTIDPEELPPPMDMREVVITKAGNVRQAGATTLEGPYVGLYKKWAERDLYTFCRNILGLKRLTNHLHLDTSRFIQKTPPYRKLVLLPRDCFKTTLVAKGLPIHIFIQPQENNVYVPGTDGVNTKILLACETEGRSSKHLQWIQAHYEKNKLLRRFWPQKCWENPKREARKWSATELLLPRAIEFEQSDMSLQAIGVGGAITGGHFDVLIKDDLISIEAMNSPTVMASTIEWHNLSRPLMEDLDKSLEFIIGTRWTVTDLYHHIMKTDPSVAVYKRALVEKGKIIFPEEFTWTAIENLKLTLLSMYPLLYQNDPTDASLTDFREDMIRWYHEEGSKLVFDVDPRDDVVGERMGRVRVVEEAPGPPQWVPYTPNDTVGRMREAFFRARYS